METAARQLQSKFEAARALLERGAAAERDSGASATACAAACGTTCGAAAAASRFATASATACAAACGGDAGHCAGALAALGALEVRLAPATGPIFVAAAGGVPRDNLEVARAAPAPRSSSGKIEIKFKPHTSPERDGLFTLVWQDSAWADPL